MYSVLAKPRHDSKKVTYATRQKPMQCADFHSVLGEIFNVLECAYVQDWKCLPV